MGRWALVVVLLITSILVAFGIFVATGVIDGSALFWKLGPKIGWLEPHLETYASGKDGELWYEAKEIELENRRNELNQFNEELEQRSVELDKRSQELDRRERNLNTSRETLKAQEKQLYNIAKLAELYSEMSVEEAARILADLEKPLLLDILLRMDLRDAANILAKLPNDLAVSLSESLGESSE